MEEITCSSPSILRRPAVFAATLASAIKVKQAIRARRNLLLVGMISLFLSSLGHAQSTIYSNTFNGAATGLNQGAPTAANNYAGGASTAIWRDSLNGTMVYANGAFHSGAPDSLELPFTPENGYVYTLTASMTFTGNPGNWVGIGFAENYVYANTGYGRFSDNGSGTNAGPGGYDWAILTESTGNVQWFAGPKGSNPQYSANGAFPANKPAPHTVVITLDTTGAQWVASLTIDGNSLGTYTYTTNPAISAVGITENTLSAPGAVQLNSFSLQATGTRSTNEVSAAVDFADTGVPLNPSFVGLSYEKQELTTSLFTSANTPLIRLFSLLGPGVLRLAGGTVDTTSWNGTSTTTPITPAEVDTFAGFIKALPPDWSVIYGINLKTNTPENAADEAAYAAKDLRFKLLGFEIGNEPDSYGSSWPYSTFLSNWDQEESAITTTVPGWDHGTGLAPRPDRMPFRAPGWDDGIGRRDWIVDGPDEGYPGQDELSKWIDPFASDETGVASLLTQHYYVGGPTGATMQTLLQLPNATLDNLVTNIVGAAKGNQALGARITECGSYGSGGTLGVSNAFGTALWSLDFMFTMAENGGQGVNFHGGDKSPYSPINNNGAAITSVGPEFYAMKMFSLIPKGGSVVPATVTLSPTDVEFSAYGVRGANGAVSALLNNKEVNDTVSASVNLGPGVSRVALISLTAPNLFDSTGFTLGGAPITTDGRWNGRVQAMLKATDGQLTVEVPPGTAYLLIPQKRRH